MNEKNEKRKSYKHKQRNILKDYFLYNFVFLLVLTAITVGVIFTAIKPVTAFVHKAEAAAPMSVADLEVKKSVQLEKYSPEKTEYASYVANITCQSRGLNAPVYLGLNRVSARNGVGVDSKAFFTENKTSVVAGYDETYFGALKYLEIGDELVVSTADAEIKYIVTDCGYDTQKTDFNDVKSDIVLYSSFSDFSNNFGKCFYVFADKTEEVD